MPYNKTYKKPYRRTYKKKTNYGTVARIAKRVVQSSKPVKETRFHVYKGLKTNVLADSFSIYEISNIALGDEKDQRDTKDIVINGLKMDLTIDNLTVGERAVRIMVLQEYNPYDPPDLTTFTDFYQSETYANRTADALTSDLTFPLNKDVWRILYDAKIILSEAGQTGCTKRLSRYLRINRRFTYDNEGALAVPTNGKLYFIVHAMETTSSGASADVTNYDGMLRLFHKSI